MTGAAPTGGGTAKRPGKRKEVAAFCTVGPTLGLNLLFFLLIGTGATMIALRKPAETPASPPATVVAKTALARNHLIQASDITGPGSALPAQDATESAAADGLPGKMIGRYLLRPVSKGETIDRRALSDRPELSMTGGFIALGIALDRVAVTSGRINAGSETILCSGTAQLGTHSYVVETVLCPARGDHCTGILLLAPARRAEAAAFGPGLAPTLSNRSCDARD